MKSSAQVVVIGGGVVGASILYHLTKRGWRDEATPGLEKNKADSGLAHRTDLLTYFDYYEVDEGRKP